MSTENLSPFLTLEPFALVKTWHAVIPVPPMSSGDHADAKCAFVDSPCATAITFVCRSAWRRSPTCSSSGDLALAHPSTIPCASVAAWAAYSSLGATTGNMATPGGTVVRPSRSLTVQTDESWSPFAWDHFPRWGWTFKINETTTQVLYTIPFAVSSNYQECFKVYLIQDILNHTLGHIGWIETWNSTNPPGFPEITANPPKKNVPIPSTIMVYLPIHAWLIW